MGRLEDTAGDVVGVRGLIGGDEGDGAGAQGGEEGSVVRQDLEIAEGARGREGDHFSFKDDFFGSG